VLLAASPAALESGAGPALGPERAAGDPPAVFAAACVPENDHGLSSVVAASTDDGYLVVWDRFTTFLGPTNSNVIAAHVQVPGAPPAARRALAVGSGHASWPFARNPRVAYDGRHALVLWRADDPESAGSYLRAERLTLGLESLAAHVFSGARAAEIACGPAACVLALRTEAGATARVIRTADEWLAPRRSCWAWATRSGRPSPWPPGRRASSSSGRAAARARTAGPCARAGSTPGASRWTRPHSS
jgi:hypothetical protein